MTLVADRTCGECTACCVSLTIDTPELQKPADVPCRNLCATGCGIYEKRPSVCRTWYCGWRYMPLLGEDMRPDKSGVTLRLDGNPAMTIQPTQSLWALLAMPVLELLGSLVEAEMPTYISMPGKPGHTNVKLHMNVALAGPVKARDATAVANAVVAALEHGATCESDPL